MADPQPRWLSDEEMESWRALVGMLVWLPSALDAQLRRDAGISHFEYQVIAMLSESPERTARMNEVAAMTDASLSRLSHVVSRLEERGWITRRPDESDGRYTLATLTDTGWDKVVETAPGHVAEVRRLVFDQLTEEQREQLRQIGSNIVGAIGLVAEWPRHCP